MLGLRRTHLDARALRVTALAALAAAALAAAPATSGAAATLSPKLVPSEGALVGMYAKARGTQTRNEELKMLETAFGRRVDIDHDYVAWNTEFPKTYHKWDLTAGRIPLIVWGSKRSDGTPVTWASIANGQQDAWIAARADAVKALGKPIMLTFHHEPEDDRKLHGTPADYVAAWRHIADLFASRGATNVVWVWNMMAYTFNPRSGQNPSAWYPGDAYVDWIGADGYNWNPCRTVAWRSFQQIFSYFYNWGAARGKPLIIPEFGVTEDTATPDPLRKANWLASMQADLKLWPEVKAVLYFNGDLWNSGSCPWWIDSTPAALEAFRTLATDPYFNPLEVTLDATSPTVTVTGPADGSTVKRWSQITIAASAEDNMGVWNVEFWVNGVRKCTDSTPPYTCNWYVGNASGTPNVFEARAYDAAGNFASHAVSGTTS